MNQNNNETKNIKLTLSWDGSGFQGYQFQPNAVTVQGVLTQAWKILSKEDVVLHGCSRLDAKVHAESYVLNFYSQTNLEPQRIISGLNGILHAHLEVAISIYDCAFVDPHFHARFHVVGKHYQYLLWHGLSENALLTKRCWVIRSSQSLDALPGILKQFEGEHDFAAYRASDCTAKTTVRRVHTIRAHQHPMYKQMHVIDVFGEGFLKNMIRNMAGTAVDVALGKLNKTTITDSFSGFDRTHTGVCAPAHALTLKNVYYDSITFEQQMFDKIYFS